MAFPRFLNDRRLLFMAGFGFLAGLPLSLSGFTLRQWLSEGSVSLAAIGLTANIGLAYSLKFLWAPLLDQRLWLGRRRGWLLLIQPLMALACLAMAFSDAAVAPGRVIAAAAALAFFSASQDIAIDAWRIETFAPAQQGAAMAVYVWAYRLAMLVAGAGVIASADVIGWRGALLIPAGLMALGVLVTWFAPEPVVVARTVAGGFAVRFATAVVDPLREFIGRSGAFLILGYVMLFKLGEAMAGVMLAPFYRALGFDRAAVAVASGPFTLAATIVGIGLGGWLIARVGLARALLWTGFIQMLAMALYVALAYSAGNKPLLYTTVIAEAFAEGLADAAFITYLSGLCAAAYTATQFALLTSLAAVALRTIGGVSGFVAQALGWKLFYALTTFASLPAMLLMLVILRRHPPEQRSDPG